MRSPLAAIVGSLSLVTCASAQSLTDPNLSLQTWVRGLDSPTGAAIFNSRGDLFATEKATGKIKIIRNRKVRGTALDLSVATDSERGLLGIALSPNFASDSFVYTYHTAADVDDGDATSNRISRYRYDGASLILDRVLRDLPATTGPNHNGGKLQFSTDGRLYAVIGDLNRNARLVNHPDSTDNSAVATILRMNPDGGVVKANPFYSASNTGEKRRLNDVFAYGIRNSFGLAFDPVSGDLWDTENGPDRMDEVNRVVAGFNSGWESIMGPTSRNGNETGALTNLGAKAAYSDPELSWSTPVAPTDLEFLSSARLGAKYKNDLFVGTLRGGKILRFDLNPNRDALDLSGGLADQVDDNDGDDRFKESRPYEFATELGVVSDLFNGPGGMYAVSLSNGVIYRITTKEGVASGASFQSVIAPEPISGGLFVAAGLLVPQRRRRA